MISRLKESTFTRKKFGYPVDEANPFIKRDPDYCILCGRCVRVCKEQGTNVLEFMGRGIGSKVITAIDGPLQESECTFCGSCVDACPVNALLESDRWRKGREWEYEKVRFRMPALWKRLFNHGEFKGRKYSEDQRRGACGLC